MEIFRPEWDDTRNEQQCSWIQLKRTRLNGLDDAHSFFPCFYSKLFRHGYKRGGHDESENIQYKGVWKYCLISHKLILDTKNYIYMYGMVCVCTCITAVSGYTKAHPCVTSHLSFAVLLALPSFKHFLRDKNKAWLLNLSLTLFLSVNFVA